MQLLLLERVHEGHLTNRANLYRDDDEGIWLPVAHRPAALPHVPAVGALVVPDRGVGLTQLGWIPTSGGGSGSAGRRSLRLTARLPSAGVHPRVAQKRLGYATVGITLGAYSHVTAGMQADAAALVASLMTQPVSNPLAEATGDDPN